MVWCQCSLHHQLGEMCAEVLHFYITETHSNNVTCSQNGYLGSASVCPKWLSLTYMYCQNGTIIASVFCHHIAYGMPSKCPHKE